jgi:FAD/FMN-containing dehydrogenase
MREPWGAGGGAYNRRAMGPPADVDAVLRELADLGPITAPAALETLSKDFYWFSPILRRELADKRAEAAFAPQSEADLARVVGACVRHRVPLTVRAGGTGNYGQCTPLHGGIVVDVSGLSKPLWIKGGVARAQAGIRLGRLNREALAHGQELRIFPSTFRVASLGGLYSGGTGGIGSIGYGVFSARGNVLGVRAMTVEETPRLVELRGDETLALQHAWGTIGIVTELEIALAPALPWVETIAVFPEFGGALRCASELAHSFGIAKKVVSLQADPLPRYFEHFANHFPAGQHAVIAIVAAEALEPWRNLVAAWGGALTFDQAHDLTKANRRTLVEYTWNHATLHVLKKDPAFTYIQARFAPDRHVEQVEALHRLFGDEVMMHTEFLRDPQGLTTCSSLPVVRYTTDARLFEIMDIFTAHGVGVANPHTAQVAFGNKKLLTPAFFDSKHRFDPHGLLNPGKLAGAEAAQTAAAAVA